MIRTYMECDAPACDKRVPDSPFPAIRQPLPPNGWLLAGLPDLEDFWEGPVERHFCSPECVADYLRALDNARDQDVIA